MWVGGQRPGFSLFSGPNELAHVDVLFLYSQSEGINNANVQGGQHLMKARPVEVFGADE